MDNFTGWKQIAVPFTSFTRSATQPAGAPNDGLTLTAVNGYGFTFPSGVASTSGRERAAAATVTTHIDQVRLIDIFPEALRLPGRLLLNGRWT